MNEGTWARGRFVAARLVRCACRCQRCQRQPNPSLPFPTIGGLTKRFLRRRCIDTERAACAKLSVSAIRAPLTSANSKAYSWPLPITSKTKSYAFLSTHPPPCTDRTPPPHPPRFLAFSHSFSAASSAPHSLRPHHTRRQSHITVHPSHHPLRGPARVSLSALHAGCVQNHNHRLHQCQCHMHHVPLRLL